MKKSVLSKLLSFLKPYYLMLIISIFLGTIYVISTLYIPVLVGESIDFIVEINNVNIDEILIRFEYIIILIIIASISQYLMTLINNRITFSFIRDLRNKAFAKIQSLPISYLDSHSPGAILSTIVQDIDAISEGLLLGFSQLFTGVISIVVTLFYMFTLNYIMAIVVVVLTPISLFVAKFVSSKINHYFKKQADIKAEQTAFIEEIVSGQKVIRAFNKEEDLQKEFETLSNRLEKESLKAIFFSSTVNPSTRFVNAFVYAIITFIGAFMIIYSGGISFTAGMLTTFLSYASQYTKPFNDISSVITEFQNSLACAKRLFDFFEEKEDVKDVDDAYGLTNANGNILIENVSFSYVQDKKLIENFNLMVHKGEHVAIVGPTGCGKTTLINLLMRFYDVDKGVIKIDGYPIKELKRSSIRDNYGMVLQDTYLRYGTIKDNITMGEEYPMEDIINACKLTHAHSFIERLEQGYDTIIDENGGGLSQGQKQLLCISRVMLKLPPMLILDEATSSIDTRTELKIQDAFNIMMKGRTSFIVAHRLSTIKNADKIIVMNEGHIIEQGNHEELLRKKGFYYRLYNSQFSID